MNTPLSGLTPSSRVRFTAADFQRMIEAGAFEDMWVELIDGDLERIPPPGRRHGREQMGVIAELLVLFSKRRVFAEFAVNLGYDTVVGPM